jgi:hypothetical protein
LQFIERCENILVLEDGKQKILGSFEQIQREGMDIKAILSEYNKAKEGDEEGKSGNEVGVAREKS